MNLPVDYASGHVNAFDLEWCVPGSIFIAKPYVPSLIGRILASAMEGSPTRNFTRTVARLPASAA